LRYIVCCTTLLEQKADPNGVDKKGNTFLHHLLINKHAVSKITPSFLELVIKKGLNIS
jgi:ankyrin repeat protein